MGLSPSVLCTLLPRILVFWDFTMRKITKVPPKQKIQLIQTRLAIGSPKTTCEACGMSYIPSSLIDRKLHAHFHTRAFKGREWFPSWGSVVCGSSDLLSGTPSSLTTPDSNIIAISGTNLKPSEKNAIKDLLQLVNSELNAPEDSAKWQTNDGAAFVFVHAKRAIGLLTVEKASTGYWMLLHNGQLIPNKHSHILMGISRLYTVKDFRRQQVALNLLEVARKFFIYGIDIPKLQIAWSQPSVLGSKVAQRWNSVKLKNSNKKVIPIYLE